MAYNILTINPGSTSTKVALFHDLEEYKTLKLSHSAEEIARFESVADQLEWRLEIILDALKAVQIPAVEVHISDVDAREPFRQISYAGLACRKTIKGHGLEGYREAILYLKSILQ